MPPVPMVTNPKVMRIILVPKTKPLILLTVPFLGGLAVVAGAFGVSMALILSGFLWKTKSIQDLGADEIFLYGTLIGGLPVAAVLFYCVYRISKDARAGRNQQPLEKSN
jgi:hypothetical protein